MDSLSLTDVSSASWSQEKFLFVFGKDSLFHSESIVIGSSSDFEDTSFKTLSESLSLDFIAKFMVDEFLPESLILEFLFDLSSILWEGNVKYHY